MKTILLAFVLLASAPLLQAQKLTVHDQVISIEAQLHAGTLKPEKAHALLIKQYQELNAKIAKAWDLETVASLLQQRDEVRRALKELNRAELVTP
jgi:hypothetical protein